MLEEKVVTVVLRNDARHQPAGREYEGVPCELAHGTDGRERVVLRVAEHSEQIVLIDRVVAVLDQVG